MSDEPLLKVQALAAALGTHQILHDVNFDVPQGHTTVLLGRNGAGKTTTLRTIMGYVRDVSGRIDFDGSSLLRLETHHVARLGIAYVPEHRGIFTQLTVEENLRLAGNEGPMWDQLLDLFPAIREALKNRAGGLSGGQQQMLAICRALLQEPRLLLLDEPSKGLAPLVIDELTATLLELKSQVTILLVEQNLDMAQRLGDRYAVIEDGVSVASGTMAEFDASSDVVSRYLTISVAALES
jgi:branched-chain amino acid transport system ATP-binding protein